MAVELSGKRILVVEDEFIIALELSDMLRGLGCEVLGPVGSVREGLGWAAQHGFPDGAVLDISLAGENVFPVAAFFKQKRVPFIFASGYDSPDLPEELRAAPVLRKPYSSAALLQALTDLFSS